MKYEKESEMSPVVQPSQCCLLHQQLLFLLQRIAISTLPQPQVCPHLFILLHIYLLPLSAHLFSLLLIINLMMMMMMTTMMVSSQPLYLVFPLHRTFLLRRCYITQGSTVSKLTSLSWPWSFSWMNTPSKILKPTKTTPFPKTFHLL